MFPMLIRKIAYARWDRGQKSCALVRPCGFPAENRTFQSRDGSQFTSAGRRDNIFSIAVVAHGGFIVSILLRCPKCQERYRPTRSQESGKLDTRCPHCRGATVPAAPATNLPADVFTSRDSMRKWIIGLVVGAGLMVLLCLVVFALAVIRLGFKGEAAPPPRPSKSAAPRLPPQPVEFPPGAGDAP